MADLKTATFDTLRRYLLFSVSIGTIGAKLTKSIQFIKIAFDFVKSVEFVRNAPCTHLPRTLIPLNSAQLRSTPLGGSMLVFPLKHTILQASQLLWRLYFCMNSPLPGLFSRLCQPCAVAVGATLLADIKTGIFRRIC